MIHVDHHIAMLAAQAVPVPAPAPSEWSECAPARVEDNYAFMLLTRLLQCAKPEHVAALSDEVDQARRAMLQQQFADWSAVPVNAAPGPAPDARAAHTAVLDMRPGYLLALCEPALLSQPRVWRRTAKRLLHRLCDEQRAAANSGMMADIGRLSRVDACKANVREWMLQRPLLLASTSLTGLQRLRHFLLPLRTAFLRTVQRYEAELVGQRDLVQRQRAEITRLQAIVSQLQHRQPHQPLTPPAAAAIDQLADSQFLPLHVPPAVVGGALPASLGPPSAHAISMDAGCAAGSAAPGALRLDTELAVDELLSPLALDSARSEAPSPPPSFASSIYSPSSAAPSPAWYAQEDDLTDGPYADLFRSALGHHCLGSHLRDRPSMRAHAHECVVPPPHLPESPTGGGRLTGLKRKRGACSLVDSEQGESLTWHDTMCSLQSELCEDDFDLDAQSGTRCR